MTQKVGARQARYLPLARNIRKELDGFLAGKTRNDTVIIAFAGHGVQFRKDEMPYFCPMDAQLTDKKTLIALGEVYKALERSEAGVRLLLVDACRNKPQSDFSRARAEVDLESLTRPEGIQPPGGVAVFFSCGAGQRAYESPTLKHGVFFHFVIEGLKGKAANNKGVVSVGRLRTFVREKVYDYVWDEFAQKQMVASLGQDEGIVPLIQSLIRDGITNSIGMKLVYIPSGRFIMGSPRGEQGRYDDEDEHEVEISKGLYMGKYEVTRGQFRQFVDATGHQMEYEKDGNGAGGYDAEKKGFYSPDTRFGFRITGFPQNDSHPVVNVSWNDAKAFCDWLSRKEGKTYSLPTEAEWEYSCRAGRRSRFHGGDDDASLKRIANVADLSLKARWDYSNLQSKNLQKVITEWFEQVSWDDGYPFTAPVGQFQPNGFGLHDMHGNVWEWCEDWYDKNYYQKSPVRDPPGPDSGEGRVVRGCSFLSDARNCRAASRDSDAPAYRCYYGGFRVVLRTP